MPLKESEIAAKIREEHKRITRDVKNIDTMIHAHVSKEDFPKWRVDLLWMLRDFKNNLHKHFDLEEEGGFMTDVIKLAPQHLNAVQRLESEHEAMIASLEDIFESLKGHNEKDDLKLEEVRRRIREFFALLESHEAAEGDLLETTYLQDEGMVD